MSRRFASFARLSRTRLSSTELTSPWLSGTWLIGSVLFAAAASAGLLGQGVTQPRDPVAPRETAASTGALTGRIVRASDGTPLARVEVRAEPTSGFEPRIALTGFDGRFHMTDVPAGQWMLTITKSGYLRMKSGQRTPTQSAKALRVSPGETTSFDAGMIPGAAITGYVIDELGDPVAGVAVEALRPRIVDGQRRLTAVARDLTDDTGAYRLHSLARGEYFVSARLRVGSPDESSGPTTALPTFFPGTTSLTEAGRISLRTGEERSGIGRTRRARVRHGDRLHRPRRRRSGGRTVRSGRWHRHRPAVRQLRPDTGRGAIRHSQHRPRPVRLERAHRS
jgi:hypothetical protein